MSNYCAVRKRRKKCFSLINYLPYIHNNKFWNFMTSKQAFFKWKRIHMWGYVRVLLTHTQSELNSFQLSCSSFSCQFFFALFCHFHYILRSFRALPCSAPLCCILFLDIIHEGIFFALSDLCGFFFRCVFSSNFTFLPRFTFLVFFFKIYVYAYMWETYIHNFL